MKKAGLITFHRPINYGAALQSVALYKAITALGVQCDLIDYRNPFFKQLYKPYHWPEICTVKNILWSVAILPINLRKNIGFRRFISRNTSLTRPITNKDDLQKFGSTYDLYITGSDQVWNLKCSGNETAYFLDFVQGKPKNAYAASFGDSDISESAVPQYRKLLSGYENISVREASGVAVVQKVLGERCVQVLDPTLLLDMQQWSEIIQHPKRVFPKKYVLVYLMGANETDREEILKAARKVAEEKGFEVLVIGESLHRKRDGIYYVHITSPDEFVALFHDAAFVVTNSFHGTAFSVNFQKEFYSYVKPDLAVEGRVESLLKMLGIENRVFSHCTDIPSFDKAVDYQKATAALQAARLDSIHYLRGVLHGN